MNALNRFAEIAALVNTWADRMEDESVKRIPPTSLAKEMRAFSNDLRSTVEMFRLIVEAAEAVVAESNVADGNMIPSRPCRQRRVHGPHYWRELDLYSCPGNKVPPTMIPEDV